MDLSRQLNASVPPPQEASSEASVASSAPAPFLRPVRLPPLPLNQLKRGSIGTLSDDFMPTINSARPLHKRSHTSHSAPIKRPNSAPMMEGTYSESVDVLIGLGQAPPAAPFRNLTPRSGRGTPRSGLGSGTPRSGFGTPQSGGTPRSGFGTPRSGRGSGDGRSYSTDSNDAYRSMLLHSGGGDTSSCSSDTASGQRLTPRKRKNKLALPDFVYGDEVSAVRHNFGDFDQSTKRKRVTIYERGLTTNDRSSCKVKTGRRSRYFGAPPYQCISCENYFETIKSLEAHVLEVHPMLRFTCSVCHAQFAKSESAKGHVRSVHNREGTIQLKLAGPQP